VPRCNAKEPVGRTAHASDNEPRRRSQHGQNEHAMAFSRKSWLFAGSERGAERAALMYTDGYAWNAVSAFANCGRAVAHVQGSHGPILLQKSFRGADRKFLEPLVRFMRGDVRNHIGSSKIDHGPP
jgi:hypothetical protein